MIEPTEPATNGRLDSPDETEKVTSTFLVTANIVRFGLRRVLGPYETQGGTGQREVHEHG